MPETSAPDQLTLPLGEASVLILPSLDAKDIKNKVWTVRHRIRPSIARRVVASRPEWDGDKEIGRSITTEKNERLLLSRREAKARSPASDLVGMLKVSESGHPLEWIAHKALQEYERDLQESESARRDRVTASWRNGLFFVEESDSDPGFRRPQIGALHAIGAHWSLSAEAASIIMPTGTGKTETMLAAMVAFSCPCVLVVTPSTAVRDQVAEKFRTLGKLREFGLVSESALDPVVGIIKRRPRSAEDLAVFQRCNVVVATVSAIAQGTAEALVPEIAARCSHLFIDEAHHVAARTWRNLKAVFSQKPVLQFTATPFREDGERIEGKLIYSYPLATAQRERYFRHINFVGIFEENQEKEDEAIARAAVERLRQDIARGFEHILMARCASKARAKQLHAMYQAIAPDLNPLEIHSDIQNAKDQTDRLIRRESKIVVCVNMLAEGFDLPNLKVAAVHDKHKSLAVLLQFIGRFTRTASPNTRIDDATVVANIADPDVAESLRSLYVEDADWDCLLAEVSLDRMQRERRIMDFLRSAQEFKLDGVTRTRPTVALGTIRPKQSVVVYEAKVFKPEAFVDALATPDSLQSAWVFSDPPMVVSVHTTRERVSWTRNRRVEDELWELRVAYFHKETSLLFIHGSDQESLFGELATVISAGTARRLEGSDCFRVFGGINRLTLHQIGIKKQGARKAVSYTQHSGSDVTQGLAAAELQHSRKAMIAGTGFEKGARTAVGGSRKGKIWARHAGLLVDFVDWCNEIALKIRDTSIDPDGVVRDGLKSEALQAMPPVTPLRIEWGERLQGYTSGSIQISTARRVWGLYECDVELRERISAGGLEFAVVTMDGQEWRWSYDIDPSGFRIRLLSENEPTIQRGRHPCSLTDFFQEDPPAILFVDGSEVMGAEIYRPKSFGGEFPLEQLNPVDWNGVDFTQESLWKDGLQRPESVQARVIQICRGEGFDFIFNDDGAGEIADLVCVRQTPLGFMVRFVHCKFSKRTTPGRRVSDVSEVASQASRSVRWTGRFHDLVRQIKRRAKRPHGKPSRFVVGNLGVLNRYERLAMLAAPTYEIVAAQPGIQKAGITDDQKTMLAAADAYLRQTVEVPLVAWCSA